MLSCNNSNLAVRCMFRHHTCKNNALTIKGFFHKIKTTYSVKPATEKHKFANYYYYCYSLTSPFNNKIVLTFFCLHYMLVCIILCVLYHLLVCFSFFFRSSSYCADLVLLCTSDSISGLRVLLSLILNN